jgi:3D-(3,5/4)-trihydroxycyclohexane-1,2-dione acylhydrolase (decyclizing)
MGAEAETVIDIAPFRQAFARAKAAARTYVIDVKVDPGVWTEEGHAWWEIGTAEVSTRAEVRAAAATTAAGRARQRRGV